MGIVDDYLTGGSEAPAAVQSGGGIIEQYLNSPSDDGAKSAAITIRPVAPPISGVSKEASDELNSLPERQNAGGANPRDYSISEGVANYPSNLLSSLSDNFTGAYKTFTGGAGDIVGGNFKSGAAKVGLGALQGATAIPSAIVDETITKPITELTGNPSIGNRAGIIAGAAIPIAPGASIIAKNLPKNKAFKELVEKITSNGREPEKLVEVVNAMKANPRVGPADKSPAVLNMAQKLFTTEGDAAKNYLHTTSSNRVASSKATSEAAFDAAGGTPVHVVNKLNDLSTASKKVGSEKINPAIANAGPVDITNTVNSINGILKPGVMSKVSGESSLPLTSIKKELANIKQHLANDKEMRTSAQDLHDFQAGLRRTGESLLKSANSGEREMGKSLMNVRNNLVADIDKAAGGKYKPALSAYRDEMHIADAFRDGYNGVLSNSKKMENRPEFTEQWFNGLTDFEKDAAREGARLAYDTEINIAKNGALSATNVGKSDFSQQKLAILFGKERADKLLQTLDHERAISNTHNKLIEGSQTEMRRAGDEAVALPEKADKNPMNKYILPLAATAAEAGSTYLGASGAGTLAVGALAAGSKIASAAKHAVSVKLAKERNLQLAKYALPTEGPHRDALIKSLEAAIPGPKQSLLTRTGSRLSRLVSP